MSIEIQQKGYVFIGFIIMIICIAFFATRSTNVTPPEGTYNNVNHFTKGFFRSPPQDIDQLIKSNPTATIVDCSSDNTYFSGNQKIPNAIWSRNPLTLYDRKETLILYSTDDGSESIEYAKELMNHVYGQVYILEGGFNAWQNYKGS